MCYFRFVKFLERSAGPEPEAEPEAEAEAEDEPGARAAVEKKHRDFDALEPHGGRKQSILLTLKIV